VTPADGRLTVAAETTLPTRYGPFRLVLFRHESEPGAEHLALVAGEIGGDHVLVRVHSECLTGEVLGSLKCDCAQQLDRSLSRIAREGRGTVIYLRQEGRGIGLANKLRAYALQERGLDTVDANRALGFADDARRYDAAADILAHLGVRSVRLMTNNPAKVAALRALGVVVRRVVPVVVAANRYSAGYLATKRARMAHLLPEGVYPS